MDLENIKLKSWQKKFLQFVAENENKIINLYGYPYGKTFLSMINKNNNYKYYHDNRFDENEYFIHTYPIKNDIDNNFTVIIITVEKLIDEKINNCLYFKVNENDRF